MNTQRSVDLTIEYPERSSRILNVLFLKVLLVIPHLIVLSLFALLISMTSVVAWFGILFTGRYPRRLWNLSYAYIRYTTHLNAYLTMLTDQRPKFWPERPQE
ncbi:MAG: DUF4389 domain-containing protein [Chloroflexota bacterium]